MSPEPSAPRTRRAVLAAAAAAAVATVAEATVRPLPALADTPALLLNATNTSTAQTTVDGGAFTLLSLHGSGVGLHAESSASTAVVGVSTNLLTGVYGYSGVAAGDAPAAPANVGVYGYASSVEASTGVLGSSVVGTGVEATSGSGLGVYATSSSFIAVKGETTAGFIAIWGANHGAGIGVEGSSASGKGVHGIASSGYGVYAESATGTALRAVGKVSFSRSGRVAVASGVTYKDVAVAGGLGRSTKCFAQLQGHQTGLAVSSIAPNTPAAGQMRVWFTRKTTAAIALSWFVLD
ncbi:MAG: hypothetical protein U0838_10760 [Chloroflexota bacterium]